eukprot:GGOE01025520.1.p1 GENE.GGOE01025520.1~~GGOE01025520.1.p1  ORF type:complete len:374 (+),score=130.81 GGOE01025520.1:66-1187(+)
MAAVGRAASKKAEMKAYNMGDEGFYEDDGAGLDDDYYLKLMKDEEAREKNQVKQEPTTKESVQSGVLKFYKGGQFLPGGRPKHAPAGGCFAFAPPSSSTRAALKELKDKAQEDEFEKRKAMGLVHMSLDNLAMLAAEELKQRERKKAERLNQIEEEEKRAQLEALRQEKIRVRKYRKSSEYKRKCWEEKVQVRVKHEEEWKEAEKAHRQQEEEHRMAKELFERQKRIDDSWQPRKGSVAKAKPKPKPKPKGKGPDLSKYGGALPAVALAKLQQQQEEVETGAGEPAEEKLPWDPEKGEKDPNRPSTEKKAEDAAWEKRQKAWKKHQEEWSRMKQEHNKEVQRMTEEGLYDSEPEFHTDEDSGNEKSESDSDSD